METQEVHHRRMAMHHKWDTPRTKVALVLHWWGSHNRCGGHEKYKYYNCGQAATAGTGEVPNQPHRHWEIRLPTRESLYWVNMNINTENAIRNWIICLEFQVTTYRPGDTIWGTQQTMVVTGIDIFQIKNEHFSCIIDYFSKFPIIKCAHSLSPKCLLACC